jgi:ribose-phosphate pyrophosphokinase
MNSLIFSGRSNPDLFDKICNRLKDKEELDIRGRVTITDFPSGEIHCQYNDNIRGKHVFIVQSTDNPNHDWMELFIMTQTARLANASAITVVIPYLSYARQDRKDKPRVPISVRLMLDLICKAGATRILTLEPHNLCVQGMSDVPLDTLMPCNLLIDYFRETYLKSAKDLKKWMVVCPDTGGIKKAEQYSEIFNLDFGIIVKKRKSATDVEQKTLIGNVRNKNILLIDDMSESLGTMSGAGKLSKERGAKLVVGFATHLPLTDRGKKNVETGTSIDKLITTNSVTSRMEHEKIHRLDASHLIASAISNTLLNKSISGLFKIKGA